MYDVCIVGAGPVGLTLAVALQKSQTLSKILVIDSQKKPNFSPSISIPNQRVLSVTQSSREIFQSLGAWDELKNDRINEYNRMIISEQGQDEVLEFTDQVAHIIEYDNIVNSLQKVYDGEIRYETKLENIEIKENEYVKVNNEFECKLIVGSDGNKSKVKESAKIGTYGHSYHQMGIVCTVEREDQDNMTAYQTYLKNGTPLALLPLYNPYSSIVWSAMIDDYKYLMSLSDNDFLNLLNQQLPKRVKSICNKRLAFPLNSLQAQHYISHRVALIGDAAHSIHPLAGQGMNMGLNDAAFLANAIIRNAKTGNDIGLIQSLQEYESNAKVMNYSTAITMEALKQLYEQKSLGFIRQFGHKLINATKPLKDQLISNASKHPLGPKQYEWIM